MLRQFVPQLFIIILLKNFVEHLIQKVNHLFTLEWYIDFITPKQEMT